VTNQQLAFAGVDALDDAFAFADNFFGSLRDDDALRRVERARIRQAAAINGHDGHARCESQGAERRLCIVARGAS